MTNRKFSSLVGCVAMGAGALVLAGCPSKGMDEVSGSEVAVSAVSGAINNTETQSPLGFNTLPRERKTTAGLIWDQINPVRPAWAATWTCSGGVLSPAWSGPAGNPYTYTPVSCSMTWDVGKTASAVWSDSFILSYGASCDSTSPFMENQAANCTLTRTTTTNGNTRTLTGARGNTYAITHNTFGAGTGWDSSVAPAPTNDGVMLGCAPSGCSASLTLVISGSHISGTINSERFWDHTVSTGPGGITVTGTRRSRVVTGTVFVQHNLAHFTSQTTFNDVAYGDTACCYPTSGSVTTIFSSGPNKSKSESLSFTPICGDATLTRADGSTTTLSLEQCL